MSNTWIGWVRCPIHLQELIGFRYSSSQVYEEQTKWATEEIGRGDYYFTTYDQVEMTDEQFEQLIDYISKLASTKDRDMPIEQFEEELDEKYLFDYELVKNEYINDNGTLLKEGERCVYNTNETFGGTTPTLVEVKAVLVKRILSLRNSKTPEEKVEIEVEDLVTGRVFSPWRGYLYSKGSIAKLIEEFTEKLNHAKYMDYLLDAPVVKEVREEIEDLEVPEID